jgi:hypothetical protein
MQFRFFAALAALISTPFIAFAIDTMKPEETQGYAIFDALSGKMQTLDPDILKQLPAVRKPEVRYGFERRMALSGHGVLFDIDGHVTKIGVKEALGFQKEILSALEQKENISVGVPEKIAQQLAEVAGLALKAADDEKDPSQKELLRNISAKALAWQLHDVDRSSIVWRLNYIETIISQNRSVITSELVRRYEDLLSGIVIKLYNSDYIQRCEKAGVPIPPDFYAGSSKWAYQGDLTTRMIAADKPAQVWTWASPTIRGACIALPRGMGDPNDLVGVICQSAFTGAACFWDNLDRNTISSASRLGWSNGSRLRMNELQDATMLKQNCTDCHQGNNVFLVLPDDPTWCKLLRRGNHSDACPVPAGANVQNLTLKTDDFPSPVLGGKAHRVIYSPISSPERAATWTNSTATDGCMRGCHLNAQIGFSAPANSMPPACSRGNQGVAGCY